jgi:hypothetical protein
MSNTPNSSETYWLESLGRSKEQTSFALLGTAVAAAGAGIVLIVLNKPSTMPIIFGCIWAALALGGIGLWSLLRERGQMSDADAGRALVVSVGALLGLGLFFVAVLFVYTWWETVGGGLEGWQGENGWRIWVIALIGICGLALTFAGLLVGRTEEQSNPLLRRLLYGYNAILAGQLVLIILLVINILGYLYLPQESDWTRNRLYTLNPKSQNILKNLENPLKVYVIVDSRDDRAYEDVSRLLENSRAVNPKVQVETVLRGRQSARVQELMRRYLLIDPLGLLVVYGSEPKEDSQFIKLTDLYEFPPFNPMQRQRTREEPTFKGEDALMTAITYLEEGRSKPVVYFLQGHGELDISRSAEGNRPQHKADELRSLLEKANYTVKPLRLSAAAQDKPQDGAEVESAKVPDDASVVVIAGPRTSLGRDAIAALDQYMNPREKDKKKGKMLVLFDIVVGPDKQMVRTGLEDFLAKFNVEVGNDRIMSPDQNNPEMIYATPNPAGERNPLVAGLGDATWPMVDVRTVKPRMSNPGPPQGSSNYQAEALLTTTGRVVWSETNLDDPVRVIEELVRNKMKGLRERLVQRLPLAVTVSEPTGGMAGDPHAGMFGGGESKPRMVVFGNAAWASDKPLPAMFVQSQQANSQYYSLFASSLAWLRERPGAIGIEAKKRDVYAMPETTNVTRMLLLPGALMFVSILGLGLGMWVVRRR